MTALFAPTDLVVPFEKLRMTDVEAVGGKNASLGEMISQLPQGVRVPTGFATTAHAFREFLAHDGLSDRISARLAALTPLFEFTARDLDERGDEVVSEISGRLRTLAGIFARSGFAAMFDALATRSRFDERMLGRIGGERTLTDLRHVAELVQHATVTQVCAANSLAAIKPAIAGEGRLANSMGTATKPMALKLPHHRAAKKKGRRSNIVSSPKKPAQPKQRTSSKDCPSEDAAPPRSREGKARGRLGTAPQG